MRRRLRQLEKALQGRQPRRVPPDPETAVKMLRAIWWERMGEEPPAVLKRWVCIPPLPGGELRGYTRLVLHEAGVNFVELLRVMSLADEPESDPLPSVVVGDESWGEPFEDPEPSPVLPGDPIGVPGDDDLVPATPPVNPTGGLFGDRPADLYRPGPGHWSGGGARREE